VVNLFQYLNDLALERGLPTPSQALCTSFADKPRCDDQCIVQSLVQYFLVIIANQ